MKKISLKNILLYVFIGLAVFGVATFAVVQSLIGDSNYTVSATEVLTTSQLKQIQQKLKNWGYYTGKVDGINGPKTIAAVKSFQRKNGLKVDGIVGTKTAQAMGISLGSTNQNSDLYLLAKAIHAEARGEPYTGQVAVGAVILNRVKSSKFPNSVSGVVYQRGAFTAVADGQINLEPNQSAYNAARDAINGWDPTYGCLYYYNPATATSAWIWSLKVTLTIGKHSFCLGN